MLSKLPSEWETTPLYYESPGVVEFTATVRQLHESANEAVLVLDQTAFYPEGGGQPADRGTLGLAPVSHVEKDGDTIRHIVTGAPVDVDGEPAAAGSKIAGRIDPAHRRDYAQQHTGQHVLSGALLRVAGRNTVSVHQGEEFTTIEVDAPSMSEEELHAVEDAANGVIEEDRPVGAQWVAEDQIATLNLRRPPKVSGVIRVVQIGDWDHVACGGVHLERTGRIRLVLTAGTESLRGNTRIHYLVGDRAVAAAGRSLKTVTNVGSRLSVPPNGVQGRVTHLLEQLTESRSRIDALEQSLGTAVAERLIAEAATTAGAAASPATSGPRVITATLHEGEASLLRSVTERLVTESNLCAALVVEEAPTADRPGRLLWSLGFGPDCGMEFAGVRDLLEIIDGKGGGRGGMAQGVGTNPGGADDFLAAFRERAQNAGTHD